MIGKWVWIKGESMNLSVCIIVKNQQKELETCLKSLAPLQAEIIVVDTGSSDQSRQIAKNYTKSVYDYTWCDDFSKAKNYAIKQAANEMVLILDSDEFLESFAKEQMESYLREKKDQVGRIRRRNLLVKEGVEQINEEWVNRIFSKELFQYAGKIHEQVIALQKEDPMDYKTYEMPFVIKHTGYLGTKEQLEEKAKRNLKLLLIQLQEQGEDPYILYQIGKSYALLKEAELACSYYAKALSFDLNPKLEYVIDMVESYGYNLLEAKQYQQALSFEQIYDTFSDTADFVLLMGFIYMNNERYAQAIEMFLKATTIPRYKTLGANTFLAYYNAAVVKECLNDVDNAYLLYKKCGNYPPAKARMEYLKKEKR